VATGITVNATGAKLKIKRLRNGITPANILQSIGNAHLYWINKNFRSEGSHGGRKWVALAPATIAARRKNGRGAQILRDTGRLSQSFIRGNSGNVFNRGQQTITIGTTVEYAPDHEYGMGLPQRKIMPTAMQAKLTAKRELLAIYRRATR
jgi:phage gpG-like protein